VVERRVRRRHRKEGSDVDIHFIFARILYGIRCAKRFLILVDFRHHSDVLESASRIRHLNQRLRLVIGGLVETFATLK